MVELWSSEKKTEVGLGRLLDDAEQQLKRKKPLLVGHNMFFDLCFLYATFFGPLPATLDEFGCGIHGLFPKIVDTKYFATHGDHDMMPAQTLDELYASANKQDIPFAFSGVTETRSEPRSEEKHRSMTSHHAGYDSK